MFKDKKRFLLLIIILLLVIIFISSLFKAKSKSKTTGLKNESVFSKTDETNKNTYTDEEEKVVLNFKDTQVIMRGYPLISKDYVKIFNFVYLGVGSDEDSFVKDEVSVDQQGSYSYKSSSNQNKIFTGVGKDSSGKPIKQTMEIVSLNNLSEVSLNCQVQDEDVFGLSVKSISCPSSTSASCWIAIDKESALLYKQESEEKISNNNMCENFRKNGIREIGLQKY